LLSREQQKLATRKLFIQDRAKDNLQALKLQLSKLHSAIRQMTASQLTAAANSLKMLQQLIKYLSPATILKRGYALVYQEGKIVTGKDDLRAGSLIDILLSEATIHSIVKEIKTNNEEFPNL
jgi:exodeoxyribonuclease VII large subunit